MKNQTTTTTTKDFTTYVYNEFFYNKNGLALAIIKDLIKKYPDYKKMNNDFEIDGIWYESFMMVAPTQIAIKRSQSYKRYFLNKEDILVDKKGNKVAVCNQWSKDNLPGLIKYASKHFNFKIKTVK